MPHRSVSLAKCHDQFQTIRPLLHFEVLVETEFAELLCLSDIESVFLLALPFTSKSLRFYHVI